MRIALLLSAVFFLGGAPASDGQGTLAAHRSPADQDQDISAGLPTCFDLSYRSDPGYLPYELAIDLDQFSFPLSETLEVKQDGKTLSKGVFDSSAKEQKLLISFFPSRHFVFIPEGSRISETENSRGESAWSFPEGTTFIHEVYEDRKGTGSDLSHLLEVSVERKIGGVFRFGVYDPAVEKGCPAGSFARRAKPVTRLARISAPDSAQGNVEISFRPLAPKSCLECHAMETAAADGIQPCGFADPLRGARADISRWSAAYEKKFGHSPLAPRAETNK